MDTITRFAYAILEKPLRETWMKSQLATENGIPLVTLVQELSSRDWWQMAKDDDFLPKSSFRMRLRMPPDLLCEQDLSANEQLPDIRVPMRETST